MKFKKLGLAFRKPREVQIVSHGRHCCEQRFPYARRPHSLTPNQVYTDIDVLADGDSFQGLLCGDSCSITTIPKQH